LPYLPALNGASRVGRCLLEGLAERKHSCRVVSVVGISNEKLEQFGACRKGAGCALAVRSLSPASQEFSYNGVEIYSFSNASRLHERLIEHIREFAPTWIIISEDSTYMLLAAATKVSPGSTLFFSQSQSTLPFGPEAFASDRLKTQLLKESAGILTTSQYVTTYIQRWAGLESTVITVPVYGVPPFPNLGSFENRYVTIINPSNIKGLPIFLQLARRFRHFLFAGVPTWATTAADRNALETLPNVTIIEPVENIDDIFRQTRVLLVPSLWGEAFGLVVVEAMLRGIPVLASNVGGLLEAKLGVDYVLPVHRIEKYEDRRDENGIAIPIIPAQEIEPWESALQTLLSDKTEFERISAASRKAALAYVMELSLGPAEQYLDDLLRRRSAATSQAQVPKDTLSARLAGLSPKRLEAVVGFLKNKSRQG
jgi:glycosyltransferase involved in cell wall biosynthesis